MHGDVVFVMNIFDTHVQPSVSQAFANVLAEAMACGFTCIVTDVGHVGWVVPPQNPELLAKAIEAAVSDFRTPEFALRRLASRKRIVDNFSLEKMTEAYLNLWRSLLPLRK